MIVSDPVEVRVPAHLVQPLRAGVAYRRGRESVAFGLASHTTVRGVTVLLVRAIRTLPDEAYVAATGHGAMWTGASMLPLLNEAIAQNLGVVAFHSHGHRGPVALSGDDLQSARRLLPVFQNLVPVRPHASLVLSDDHANGIALLPSPSRWVRGVGVRCLGKVIEDLRVDAGADDQYVPEAAQHRQALLTGGRGEARLRRTRVAVVGLSGGGSHVVQQLAHMGVGRIIGIDGDHADEFGRSRTIGLSEADARLRRRKTAVMRRLVRRINRQVEFTGVHHPVPEQRAIDALKEADIVVGCVDSHHSRADLQELATRYLLPYVDIGLLIRPIEDGTGIAIGGNVITSIPGIYCQWCVGVLSRARLEAETGGRPRSYFEGADEQAQVVSMNGLLASQAVNEVLQLVTGFAPVDDERSIKKFDGLAGTLTNWIVQPNELCAKCREGLGAGDVVWKSA